jgi:cytochrome c553
MIGTAPRAILACVLTLAALGVHAEDKAARSLAATCTGCHGTNGVSAGGIPTLAGVEAARIAGLMREFRDGTRSATVMHQHTKGYTDEQIDAVAAWFAAQKAR